jgi:hypothetical protein
MSDATCDNKQSRRLIVHDAGVPIERLSPDVHVCPTDKLNNRTSCERKWGRQMLGSVLAQGKAGCRNICGEGSEDVRSAMGAISFCSSLPSSQMGNERVGPSPYEHEIKCPKQCGMTKSPNLDSIWMHRICQREGKRHRLVSVPRV